MAIYCNVQSSSTCTLILFKLVVLFICRFTTRLTAKDGKFRLYSFIVSIDVVAPCG